MRLFEIKVTTGNKATVTKAVIVSNSKKDYLYS